MDTHRALSPPANTQATSPLLHDHFWHDFNERQVRSALAKLKPHAQPVDTEREWKEGRVALWIVLTPPSEENHAEFQGSSLTDSRVCRKAYMQAKQGCDFFSETQISFIWHEDVFIPGSFWPPPRLVMLLKRLSLSDRSQGSPEERIRFGFLHEGWHFQPDSQACRHVGSHSILIRMFFTFRISDFIMITFIWKVFFSFLQLLGSWLSLIVQPRRFFSFWPFCPPRQTESLHVDCKS